MNKIIIVVGNRGTGKTDYLKNLAHKMINVFPKVLVVDLFDSDTWRNLATHDHPERVNFAMPILPLEKFKFWKSGVARMFSKDTDAMFDLIDEHAKNTFVIYDDSSRYLRGNLTKKQRMIVLDSKQKNLDQVFVFHRLMDVPPGLIQVADFLTLFKTSDNEVPEKYPFGKEIEAMRKKIADSPNRYYNLTIQLN